MLDGRADLGIFADRTPALGLHALTYRHDRLALVVPAGHPLARRKAVQWEQAAEFDFVTRWPRRRRCKRLETEKLGRRLKNRIQVRSFDAMCRMVAAGMGVAVLPDVAVEPLLKPLNLRRVALEAPWAERTLLIGVRDLDALPQHVRVFIDHLCGMPGSGRFP